MNDRCGCGAWTVAGLRYEASRTVEVRLCPSCWREEPPLYALAIPRRVKEDVRATWRVDCAGCGAAFIATSKHPDQRYCTRTCRNWGRRAS
mgnify:CR=1 FL=1